MLFKNSKFFVAIILSAGWLLLTALNAQAADQTNDQQEQTKSGVVKLTTVKVTAEKREENVQDIPASITTLSETEIEDAQVWSTDDLIGMVPNLFMIKTGNHSMGGFMSIRGITSWMAGEPTVGFYIDDVYYSTFDTELLDVKRIEVLRGPQGTLYGRNTEAGVINVISNTPSDDKWQGLLSADIGNYNTQTYRARVSGPVVKDKFLIRLAAKQRFSDGYFNNTYLQDDSADKNNDFSGRATAVWTPADRWDLRLSSEMNRFRDGNACFAPLDQVYSNPHDVTADNNGESDYDSAGYAFRLGYKGDAFNLTAITALRNEERTENNDVDFSPMYLMRLDNDTTDDLLSQEIRVTSPNDGRAFEWLLGFYYFTQEQDLTTDMSMRQPTPLPPPLPPMPPFSWIRKSDTDINGYAFFGQGAYRFFDKLKVTLGLRYDHEDKDFSAKQYYDPDLSMFGMTPISVKDDAAWNEWLPKFSVDYTFRQGLMTYASVARGYKSGGFNTLAPASEMSYDPEYTTNYEVGLKSAWLDNRFILNLSVFHIDWSDQQIEQQSYPESITRNAGKSTSQGFELEMAAIPLRGLHLSCGLGYVDATFDEYTDDIIDPSTGAKTGTVDYAGNRIPNVPEYTFNLAAQYRGAEGFFARASLNGVGPFYWDTANSQEQSAYQLVNAKVGWEWERIQFYFWGKNVFDENYATRAFEMGGTWFGRAGDPQTYGVTLQGRF